MEEVEAVDKFVFGIVWSMADQTLIHQTLKIPGENG